MKHGFKKRANQISKKARLKLGLQVKDYLDPNVLAEAMKAQIIDPANLNIPSESLDILLNHREDEWSALGAHINGNPAIFINSSHPKTRIEASIMHELAHFILKHEPMGAVNYFGLPLTRFDKAQEEEAEFLGGCLQIPEECLFPLFAFEKYNLQKLAEHFHCSKQVARMRYNQEGIRYRVNAYNKKYKQSKN